MRANWKALGRSVGLRAVLAKHGPGYAARFLTDERAAAYA
jgi:hypothetical protein